MTQDTTQITTSHTAQIPQDAMLLRIFFGENDRFGHQPLHEAIVLKAREARLAGATVLRGPMGFGQSSCLHTAKILRLSFDLPMIVEIVDTEEKIRAFLPTLDGMMPSGLITLEKVQVLQYGRDGLKERAGLA
jgi:PII-like signaling protein